jgi:PHP family Zn ribbon phosphoesterase
LTIGVLNRVDNLRDREFGKKPSGLVPYKHIVPLPDIIADYYETADTSQRVMKLFFEIIRLGGNEFRVLLDASLDELQQWMPEDLAGGIMRVRDGKLTVNPGYDGNYGSVSIFSEESRKKPSQKALL